MNFYIIMIIITVAPPTPSATRSHQSRPHSRIYTNEYYYYLRFVYCSGGDFQIKSYLRFISSAYVHIYRGMVYRSQPSLNNKKQKYNKKGTQKSHTTSAVYSFLLSIHGSFSLFYGEIKKAKGIRCLTIDDTRISI